jgi:dTDP-4-amino-4,6-dideoxygalactose transaminase
MEARGIGRVKWTVPFADIRLGEEEKAAVLAVLDSNWLTMGPRTEAFETAFAAAMDASVEAVALSNCTAALHLALVVLGIGPGDEVICPSLTFVATANAARYVGATPVFADVCSDAEWNLDPEDVARKITSRTKAIIVVHYGGYPVRMERILDLAHANGIKIVEDACHGPLSEWQGRKLGTIGHIGCFSFFSNKNMTTGEGGMIVTGDHDIAARIRIMRSHGLTTSTYARFQGHAYGYDVASLGFNYRMTEIHAAIGEVQLRKLPAANSDRAERVGWYREALRTRLQEIGVPFADWNGRYAYHIFPEGYQDRGGLMTRLADSGIQTSFHYRPIHTLSDFVNSHRNDLPVTDRLAPRILSLPLFPALTRDQVGHVVDQLARSL